MKSINRIPMVIGNWKMNLDHRQAAAWLKDYKDIMNGNNADNAGIRPTIAVLPSFTSLYTISMMSRDMGLDIGFGAQTVSEPKSGAFTGDVSAGMLSALDCDYVLIGHSEQRRYHPEDDDRIADKVRIVLDNNMTPIICIGETRLGREHGIGIDYALNQLAEAVALLDCNEITECIIAYEPVWSIGTGITPPVAVIEAALADIRDFLNATFGADIADKVRILYGGSVTEKNASEFIRCHDIDGFLVGGASLNPESFTGIINAVTANNGHHDRRPVGGISAMEPIPFDERQLNWRELSDSAAIASNHTDTPEWRAQLALAAYRTVGFQWLEKVAGSQLLQAVDSSGAVFAGSDGIDCNPDLLRDEIWASRLDIIRRTMVLINQHRIRGIKSVNEWLVMQDDSLSHDERCEKLTDARADSTADIAYDEMVDGSMDKNQFNEIFKAGYLSADADTRNRHWRRRGIDKKALKPWKW